MKPVKLETSNLVSIFILVLPTKMEYNILEMRCGLGHVTLVKFSITLEYICTSTSQKVVKSPKFDFYRKFKLTRTTVKTDFGLKMEIMAFLNYFPKLKITKLHKLPTSAVIKHQI